jgi:ABC-type transport system involved in cytochrome bd biosynthesis fused ATPase/permease subunit
MCDETPLCCSVCSVLQYLKRCDQVYMMKDGHTCCCGTHDELMDREQDYVMLVNTHSSETGDQAQ